MSKEPFMRKRLVTPLRALVFMLVTMLAGALVACSDRGQAVKFKSSDITGAGLGGDFAMTDHTGKTRKLSDFKGKVVVVFFGFMNCPDVCPTTLAELAAAMKELGDKGKDVQVLFVTVDPERDTPELLAQYVPAFHRDFLALRGSPTELERATKAFKVLYQKSPNPKGGYGVDHTASSFVIDRQGQTRLLVPYGAGASVFAHDLRQLLG